MEPTNQRSATRNSQSKGPQSIELHIEQLVLHGFQPGDAPRIGEAVQQELERLLSVGGAPPSFQGDLEISRIDSGAFRAESGATARETGAKVGQAIYGGFRG